MRQALHIFGKDIRRLRFEIAAALVLFAAFAFTGVRLAERTDEYLNQYLSQAWILEGYILPFAWWLLVARVIHAEPLPGDRQFWITRPYAWTSLLAAKALFVAVFVNLPLLGADVAILRAHGFGFAAMVPGLAGEQVLLTLLFLIPFAALCAITAGLVQLLSICLASWVAWVVWSVALPSLGLGGQWYAVEWVKYGYAALILTIVCSIVLLWQYSRRRTILTRVLTAAGAVLVVLGVALIPWTAAYAVQCRFSKMRIDESSIDVGYDVSRTWLTDVLPLQGDRVQIQAPIQIRGMAPGIAAWPDGAEISIETPDGRKWPVTGEPWQRVRTQWSVTTLQATLDRSFYDRIKSQPVIIRGRLFVTLYGNRRTTRVAFDQEPVPTPGVGVCSATRSADLRQDLLSCTSAFRTPAALVSVRFRIPGREEPHQPPVYSPLGAISYSPFPAEFDISPVRQHLETSAMRGPASWVSVDTLEPLAHIRPKFEIAGLRFEDFEAHPAAPVLLPTDAN